MVPKALARSVNARGEKDVQSRIPREFTLGTGHVMFFYDKGSYLYDRYAEIKLELDARGIQYSKDSVFDPDGIMQLRPWAGIYTPTSAALQIIRQRIAEKIAMKPEWYKFYGRSIGDK
jgi:deoxyribonuclease (pyrimidine dimer)